MANAVEVKLPAMWECNSWVGRLSDRMMVGVVRVSYALIYTLMMMMYKGDRFFAHGVQGNFGDREWDSLNIVIASTVVAMKNQLS